jgi:hypothetical protein
LPGPFDDRHHDRHHQAGRQQLKRRGGQRRRIRQLTPCKQRRQSIAEGPGETEQDADALAGVKAQILSAQNDHADQPGDDARDATRIQFFVAGGGHHHHGEQRRGCVQDGGEAARDIGLSRHHQRERQDVVEKRHREKWFPAR